jgi:hypothetical protein
MWGCLIFVFVFVIGLVEMIFPGLTGLTALIDGK